jgi:protein O-GlcNAc transferase
LLAPAPALLALAPAPALLSHRVPASRAQRASPSHLAHYYSEKLLWMPNSYFVNDYRRSNPAVSTGILPPELVSPHWVAAASHPPLLSYEWYARSGQAHLLGPREEARAKLGLPPFALLFCCFNQLYKLEPQTFACWCSILQQARLAPPRNLPSHLRRRGPPSRTRLASTRVVASRATSQVPNSVLWLLRFPALAEAHILAAAAKAGLARERIIFTDVADKPVHIARSSLADLVLDTPMCNGHTTGCDVLWAGVPMITHPMETMCSRVASSLNHALGMEQCNVPDMAHYVQLAVSLASDRPRLLRLRQQLWCAAPALLARPAPPARSPPLAI